MKKEDNMTREEVRTLLNRHKFKSKICNSFRGDVERFFYKSIVVKPYDNHCCFEFENQCIYFQYTSMTEEKLKELIKQYHKVSKALTKIYEIERGKNV